MSLLQRQRRRARARPTEEQLARKWSEPCFLRRFSERACEGSIDLAHLLPRQRLEAAGVTGEAVWEPVVVACRAHHHAFDMGFIELPRDQLPWDVEVFASEHGLTWSLDRDFGEFPDEVPE